MNLLKPFGTESFLIGIGIAAASYLLGPTIKRGARGVAVKGMQGALMAGDAANDAMETSKDKFNDFIQNMMGDGKSNVNFEHMENSFHKDLIDELKADRHQNSELMKELVSSMKSLQSEIKDLKKAAPAATQATKTNIKNTTTK